MPLTSVHHCEVYLNSEDMFPNSLYKPKNKECQIICDVIIFVVQDCLVNNQLSSACLNQRSYRLLRAAQQVEIVTCMSGAQSGIFQSVKMGMSLSSARIREAVAAYFG